MNGGGVIDVALDVQAEARERLMQTFKDDSSTVLVDFTAGELDCVKQYLADFDSTDLQEAVRSLRYVLRDVIEPTYFYPINGRDYPWQQHFFIEELSSDTTLFRFYAVLKKPGIMDALIHGVTKKIMDTMRHVDVDTPQVVYFAPLAMCSLYVPVAEEIYLRHVRVEASAALAPHHITIEQSPDDSPYSFICRRTG